MRVCQDASLDRLLEHLSLWRETELIKSSPVAFNSLYLSALSFAFSRSAFVISAGMLKKISLPCVAAKWFLLISAHGRPSS
jgi:hypothetical protein